MPRAYKPEWMWNYTPAFVQVETPTVSNVLDGDLVCVTFSRGLLAWVLTGLEVWCWESSFRGTAQQRQDAARLFRDLQAHFMESECGDVGISNIRVNGCNLEVEYSTNPGLWVAVGDLASCMVPGPQGPPGEDGEDGAPGLPGEQGPAGPTGPAGTCDCADVPTESEAGITDGAVCNAAAYFTDFLYDLAVEAIAIARAATSAAQWIGGLTEANAVSWIPVLGDLLSENAEAIWLFEQAALDLIDAELASVSQREAIRCEIYCGLLAEVDQGQLPLTNAYQIIRDAINQEAGPTANPTLNLALNVIGQDETNRRLYAGTLDEDNVTCATCNCPDTSEWCYTISSFSGDPAISLLPRFGQSQFGTLNPNEVTGQCLTNNSTGYSVRFDFPATATVERVTVNIDHDETRATTAIRLALRDENGTIIWSSTSLTEGTAYDLVLDGFSVNTAALEVLHLAPTFGCPGATANLNSITIEGTGPNPFGTDNC